RTECKPSIGNPVIDQLDTHSVTRYDQALVKHIPNTEAKHTVEMIEDICAPLFVAVDDYFRVGIRSKLMALTLQFPSQFFVIVNLAVEDYPHGFLCVRHRLMTAGEVD